MSNERGWRTGQRSSSESQSNLKVLTITANKPTKGWSKMLSTCYSNYKQHFVQNQNDKVWGSYR